MRESQVFAHHRSVFGFHQAVVSGAMRTRLGLFDQQLFEQLGDRVVDEFAAVVGMKSPDSKGALTFSV